jgi:hypothetical protein
MFRSLSVEGRVQFSLGVSHSPEQPQAWQIITLVKLRQVRGRFALTKIV